MFLFIIYIVTKKEFYAATFPSMSIFSITGEI